MDCRDLLLRHQATHSTTASGTKVGKGRTGERAIKACDACVISKLKCDNERPCQRCQKRKIECKIASLDQQRSQRKDEDVPVIQAIPTPPHQTPDGLHRILDINLSSDQMADVPTTEAAFDADLMSGLTEWQFTDLNVGPYDFPSFFEHIMVPGPDFVAAESMQVPPDISKLMPDKEWFDETDIFGLDFTPTIDQAIEATAYGFPEIDSGYVEIIAETNPSKATETANRRHTIFQRSPWYVVQKTD